MVSIKISSKKFACVGEEVEFCVFCFDTIESPDDWILPEFLNSRTEIQDIHKDTDERVQVIIGKLDSYVDICRVSGQLDTINQIATSLCEQYLVFISCRKASANKARKTKRSFSSQVTVWSCSTRSVTGGFAFKGKCLCGNSVAECQAKDVRKVTTWVVLDESIRQMVVAHGSVDVWATCSHFMIVLYEIW